MRCAAGALASVMLGCATSASFAQASPLAPGSKVRVSLLGQDSRLVGTIQERSIDSLVIVLPTERGAVRRLGVDQITKLETWDTRPNAVVKAWGVGAGIGALLGILVGATTDPPCAGGGWCIGPQDRGDMMATGVIGGAVLGGIVGIVVGATHRHGWRAIDLSVIPSPEPGKAVRLSSRILLPPIRLR